MIIEDLTNEQRQVLRYLKGERNGIWINEPGFWTWGGFENTEKILKQLVEFGFVTKVTMKCGKAKHTEYRAGKIGEYQ